MKLFRRNERQRRGRKFFAESLEERTLLAVTAGAVLPDAAAAETVPSVWVVNTLEDKSSWSEGDETVSLREAIDRANEGDLILFDHTLSGGRLCCRGKS